MRTRPIFLNKEHLYWLSTFRAVLTLRMRSISVTQHINSSHTPVWLESSMQVTLLSSNFLTNITGMVYKQHKIRSK